MDDVKDKMKGLIKKVNNPFSSSSSSSSKFKGQGRVLGSSSPANPTPPSRPNPPPQSTPNRPIPKPQPSQPSNGFDPFGPLISSTPKPTQKPAPTLFHCPVCSAAFASEDSVSAHIDTCLAQPERSSGVAERVSGFLSGAPPAESVEIVLRLLRNVVREPGNEKFRRVRMGNPKIREAVGEARGGVELLECVGFGVGEDGGEVWATMEAPDEERVKVVEEVVALLERWKIGEDKSVATASVAVESAVEKKKIDRQVRVFFPVPGSVAAEIDVPESFYNLSAEEIRREAEARRKKIAESQLLIPRSYKEKQAMAARKKYKLTIIRIQFPDGVVLQGVFLPSETTITLYEFVSSALKEPGLEFELLHPSLPKLRVIPRFPKAGDKRTPTLEEEYLVPSALIKFKPIETESIVFTGLTDQLLEASEPLTNATATTL